MDILVVKKLLDGLLALGQDNITICLHGGEPLLIGKQWFSEFLKLVDKFRIQSNFNDVSVAIQTNATLIDDEWANLFKHGEVGVSLSIDGPQSIHDFSRHDTQGKGTYNKVVSSINLLSTKGIHTSAIAVITKKTTETSVVDFYNFFNEVGLKDIDITPYIEIGTTELETLARYQYEADVSELAMFLTSLFDQWLFLKDSKDFINIRIFEQTIAVLLGFIPTVCNMQQGRSCGKNPSIMPNGDVLACDLETEQIKLKLGSLLDEDLIDIISETRLHELNSFIDRGLKKMGCVNCDLKGICGLTCPRHTFSKRDHTVYCDLQRQFVQHVKQRLNDIALRTCNDSVCFPI
jgi:uncharacterized protein